MKKVDHAGETDRRGQFRVEDSVFLDYRPVDGPVEEALRRVMAQRQWPSAFSLCSSLYAMHQESTVLRRHAERESATFSKLLDQLNRKIDMMTEVLLAQEFRERWPIALTVDVGADGLGFMGLEPLDQDGLLDLRVLFRSTGVGLHVVATVVRCEPRQDDRYSIGLVFHYPRESDRELLVHHVLQRQSMLLRDRQYP